MTLSRALKGALLVLLTAYSLQGYAWLRSPATTFATLPPGTAHPEGITADADGNLYVTDFDVSKSSGPGNIVVFDRAGRLLRTLEVQGSSNLLLGIAFHPKTKELLVIDFGNHQVLRVDPHTGASWDFSTLPAGAGPNALAFDEEGDVYISDSALARIWRTGMDGGVADTWVENQDLLGTAGVPPFGANGMAFNNAGTAMFVANTGNDTVVRIPVMGNGEAGIPEVLVNSINGADGLLIDGDDNIWVAANQADEVVVLDTTGRVIAKLGDFGGINPDGSPAGLLFPASLVISNGFVYVTNLSLDLRLFGAPTVDSQWAASVTRHTIARIRAHIPPVRGRKLH